MMEMTGPVSVVCKKTGYKVDLEFKAKPMFGGEYNAISGKVQRIADGEELYIISGKWDGKIDIQKKKEKTEKVSPLAASNILWQPTAEARKNKTPKYKPGEMGTFESEKLWEKVTAAIKKNDQHTATEEKYVLEQAQRERTKAREAKKEQWVPRLFAKEGGVWTYKYFNKTLWDPSTEEEEIECNGIISSRKKQ